MLVRTKAEFPAPCFTEKAQGEIIATRIGPSEDHDLGGGCESEKREVPQLPSGTYFLARVPFAAGAFLRVAREAL